MAPIVRGRKGEFKDLLDQLDQQGFRARVDGEVRDLSEPLALDRRKNHTIEAIVDRVLLKAPTRCCDRGNSPRVEKRPVEARLGQAVAKALQLANGLVLVAFNDGNEQLFSSSMACPDCGLDVPKLEPRSFSFNSTFGACPNCHGLGSLYDFDPAKVITDWSKPLLDGGLGPGSSSQYLIKLIQLAADRYKIDLKTPVRRSAAKTAAHSGLRPAQRRSAAHRLSRHPRLPARQCGRSAQRQLSRVHDELHVGRALPGLPRQAPAP